MRLCKVTGADGQVRVGELQEGNRVRLLPATAGGNPVTIASLLYHDRTREQVEELAAIAAETVSLGALTLLAPVDQQEIWAAGVTYKRSQEARERESVGAAQFYDKVYSAARPELFFKAPPYRVTPPGGPVNIRRDSKWSVPEPELALVISPELKLVGFTIGNDMSARDIEGENPLYLPQAKMYDNACAVGPVITLAADMPAADATAVRLVIERGGKSVFDGSTKISAMKRTFDELVDWLGRETSFPTGAILLTGTGIVPPDEFTLARGDVVHIDITGIGRLTNVVHTR